MREVPVSNTNSTQAAAEYFGVVAQNAATAFRSTTQRVSRFVMDNPVWIAVAIVLLLVLIWWSRPKAR